MTDESSAAGNGTETEAGDIRLPFGSELASDQHYEYKQNEERLVFTGVTSRAFPLRASLNKMQDFCDGYLNFADDPVAAPFYFKPAIPFVYLQMINYGEMATLSENLGWIAQEEVLFAMPVEWYDVDTCTGEMTFRDWALVCPYVFVDNDISQRTGREVYGWTKTRAWLDRLYSSWTQDPRWRRQLMDMRTLLFPGAYEGDMLTPRTLIEVLEEPSPSLFRSPTAKRDLFNPLYSWPMAMKNGLETMMGAAEFMSALPILGYDQRRSAESGMGMLRKALGNSRGVLPWMTARTPTQSEALNRAQENPYLNQITLKQFRDAQRPDQACYQGLVNSKITIDHFHESGIMGGPHVLAGDLSGGYRIKVHDYAEMRMIDTLGIEIDATTIGEHGQKVFELVPRLPFWTSVDLRYDTGDLVQWRTRKSLWTQGKDKHSRSPERDGEKTRVENAYNVTRGSAIQESYGPYDYPDMTVRVLPLAADGDRLSEFCDNYLNGLYATEDSSATVKDRSVFKPWGEHVFLTVTSYGGKFGAGSSTVDNIGQIGLRRVAFNVPVIHTFTDSTGKTQTRNGMIAPWVFNSSSRQTLSEREVNGVEAHHAMIDCVDHSWLEPSGPVEPRTLMTLRRLMMIGENAGQKAEMRELLAIRSRPSAYAPEEPEGSLTESAVDPSSVLKTLGQCLDFYSLKQIRGTGDMQKACYQALVLVQRQIKRLYSQRDDRMHPFGKQPAKRRFVEPLGDDIWLSIYYSPFWPIVETLGLHATEPRTRNKGALIRDVRADHPFFVRMSMHEQLGQVLMSRAHCDEWQFGDLQYEGDPKAHCEIPPIELVKYMLSKAGANDNGPSPA